MNKLKEQEKASSLKNKSREVGNQERDNTDLSLDLEMKSNASDDLFPDIDSWFKNGGSAPLENKQEAEEQEVGFNPLSVTDEFSTSADLLENCVPHQKDEKPPQSASVPSLPSTSVKSSASKDTAKESKNTTTAIKRKALSWDDDKNDDYCSVCHDGGDLICCCNCPRVFHFYCHVPSIKTAPHDDWFCGFCQTIDMNESDDPVGRRNKQSLPPKDLKICERMLLELYCHEQSSPFQNRVDKRTAPFYYDIIQKPMDLSSVKIRLNMTNFECYKNKDEFIADIRLITENCSHYNKPGTWMNTAGKEIEDFFESLLQEYYPHCARIDLQ